MKPPCEIIIREILPFIRSMLVKELAKENIKQREIAEKLSLTDAAVSQYLKNLRGKKPEIISKFEFVVPEIKEIAKLMKEEDYTKPQILNSICNICKEIRQSPEFCHYHKDILRLTKCEICNVR